LTVNASNQEKKNQNESRIMMFLGGNPGSTYSQIKAGLEPLGHISHPALSRHLERLRAPEDPKILLRQRRYWLTPELVTLHKNLYQDFLSRSAVPLARFEKLLLEVNDPNTLIGEALSIMALNFTNALVTALDDDRTLEPMVYAWTIEQQRLFTASFKALKTSKDGLKVVRSVYLDFFRDSQEAVRRLKAGYISDLPAELRALGEALVESYPQYLESVSTGLASIPSYLDEVMKGGKPRRLFNSQLGRKVKYAELLQLKNASKDR
jgi:hypothetical protein